MQNVRSPGKEKDSGGTKLKTVANRVRAQKVGGFPFMAAYSADAGVVVRCTGKSDMELFLWAPTEFRICL